MHGVAQNQLPEASVQDRVQDRVALFERSALLNGERLSTTATPEPSFRLSLPRKSTADDASITSRAQSTSRSSTARSMADSLSPPHGRFSLMEAERQALSHQASTLADRVLFPSTDALTSPKAALDGLGDVLVSQRVKICCACPRFSGRVGTVLSRAPDDTLVVQLQWEPLLSLYDVELRHVQLCPNSQLGKRRGEHLRTQQDAAPWRHVGWFEHLREGLPSMLGMPEVTVDVLAEGQQQQSPSTGESAVGAAALGEGALREAEQALRDFLAGPEIDMAIHVARVDELMVRLQIEPYVASAAHGHQLRFEALRAAFGSWLNSDSKLSRLLDTLALAAKQRLPFRTDGVRSKVLVVGAGPIGLRVAVEMCALGHSVTVLEKRDRCSRLNILKLWEETASDFEQLGLKLVDSRWCTRHNGYVTASTARLQLALLKVALLFGATVEVGRGLDDVTEWAAGSDVLIAACGAQGWHEGLLPLLQRRCSFGAGHLDGDHTEALKGCEAIAVVAHVECSAHSDAAAEWASVAPSFDWARQFFPGSNWDRDKGFWAIGDDMLHGSDVALENVVCYPNTAFCKVDCEGMQLSASQPPPVGKLALPQVDRVVGVPPSYYFVFTLGSSKAHGLTVADQVRRLITLPEDGEKPPEDARGMLQWALEHRAIDQRALADLAARVIERFTVEATRDACPPKKPNATATRPMSSPTNEDAACRLLNEASPPGFGSLSSTLQIFDFTERRAMKAGSAGAVVTHIDQKLLPAPLLVLPVGDALQEPFWPEGLGTNRGLHNACDASWVANKWGASAPSRTRWDVLLEERNALYKITHQLHAKSKARLLRRRSTTNPGVGAHKEFTIDPSTRYEGYASSRVRLPQS